MLKRKPYDIIREELFILKKQLKNTTKRKKKSRNENCKTFWKLLDKLKPKENEDLFKNGIPGQQWVNHFKSIYNSDTPYPLSVNPKVWTLRLSHH